MDTPFLRGEYDQDYEDEDDTPLCSVVEYIEDEEEDVPGSIVSHMEVEYTEEEEEEEQYHPQTAPKPIFVVEKPPRRFKYEKGLKLPQGLHFDLTILNVDQFSLHAPAACCVCACYVGIYLLEMGSQIRVDPQEVQQCMRLACEDWLYQTRVMQGMEMQNPFDTIQQSPYVKQRMFVEREVNGILVRRASPHHFGAPTTTKDGYSLSSAATSPSRPQEILPSGVDLCSLVLEVCLYMEKYNRPAVVLLCIEHVGVFCLCFSDGEDCMPSILIDSHRCSRATRVGGSISEFPSTRELFEYILYKYSRTGSQKAQSHQFDYYLFPQTRPRTFSAYFIHPIVAEPPSDDE